MRFSHKIVALLVITFLITMTIGVAVFASNGVVNASVLNVREYPSYDAAIVGRLNRDTAVDIISSPDGWHEINFNGYSAYVAGEYITISSEEPEVMAETIYYDEVSYGKVGVDALNIRADASYSSRVVRTINKGYKVEIRGEKGDFFIIENGEWDAFVAKQYIEAISVEEFFAKPAGAQQVIDIAMKYIGTPYRYGGSSPSGFDCSGFTSYVYSQMGISLNRTAAGQASNGVTVSKDELAPGDILLFGPYSGGGIGHVGIYVGDGNMVHSPKPGRSVCVESIYSSYYNSRYVGARRII